VPELTEGPVRARQPRCRDRASAYAYAYAYAEGARTGAPDAIQVADRFHLWANLGEAVERTVIAHRACLPATDPAWSSASSGDPASGEPDAGEPDVVEQASTAPPEHGPQPRLVTRTRERHAAVAGLVAQGYSLNAIGRELGLGFRTVQRFARAATPDDLLVIALNRPSNLDRFKPYVHRRWNAGCTDATVLHTELAELGWRGSLRTVQRYLRRFRDPDRQPQPAPAAPVKATPRRVTRWIMTDPEHLGAGDTVRLKEVLARCPELDATAGDVNAFAVMMCHRRGERLPAWMDAVCADDLPELHSLVNSLARDHAAVTNGLTLPYSSGAVEGTVNKIKMLKRQMFGRASFDLLRKRVLLL